MSVRLGVGDVKEPVLDLGGVVQQLRVGQNTAQDRAQQVAVRLAAEDTRREQGVSQSAYAGQAHELVAALQWLQQSNKAASIEACALCLNP